MLSAVRRDDEDDVLPLTLYREMVMWWQEGQGDAMQSMVSALGGCDVVLEESEDSIVWRKQGKTDGRNEETSGDEEIMSCSSRRIARDFPGGQEQRRSLLKRGNDASRFHISWMW